MQGITEALSDDFAVIAFYGIKQSTNKTETYYRRTLEWFQSLGSNPERGAAVIAGKIKGFRSFSRMDKALLSNGFESVSHFELCVTTPECKARRNDCVASATLEYKRDAHAFVTARTSTSDLCDPSFKKMAAKMAAILQPRYGIGFKLHEKLGPHWYVVGIGYTTEIRTLKGKEYEEARRLSQWGGVGMNKAVYRHGVLRDVYPWNFLTQPQLSRNVNGLPLERWIRQDSRRGTLNRLTDDMLLWEVPEGNIPEMFQILWDAGVIFNWRNYIPKDEKPVDPMEEKKGTYLFSTCHK